MTEVPRTYSVLKHFLKCTVSWDGKNALMDYKTCRP